MEAIKAKKPLWPFKKVKPVDIVAMLIILAAAAYVMLPRFFPVSAPSAGETPVATEKITVTCRKSAAFPWEYEEAVEKSFPQPFIESGGRVADAYLTGVRKEPHIESNANADGLLVSSVDEFTCDIVFTVEAVIPAGTPNIKIGSQEIRSGRGLFIRTTELDMATVIERIDFSEN